MSIYMVKIGVSSGFNMHIKIWLLCYARNNVTRLSIYLKKIKIKVLSAIRTATKVSTLLAGVKITAKKYNY